ncbi:hypothetical protein J3Q64DRAFT_1101115 [Phycomyces blakesleeanus]|uniref:Uncharacterized protein n=1 Tax=Phycomyces blakesleeanus TaxID=4837 RepID=A0ABR3AZ75_PHYBL
MPDIKNPIEPLSPIPSQVLPRSQNQHNLGSPDDEDVLMEEEEEEEVVWGERPNVDILFGEMATYLPEHDLDNTLISVDSTPSGSEPESESESEITPKSAPASASTSTSTTNPTIVHKPNPKPRSASTPTPEKPRKSMRDLGQEAHNNWRKAIGVIHATNVLKRRSTVISGTRVQQIKPGMATNSKVLGRKRNQQDGQGIQLN